MRSVAGVPAVLAVLGIIIASGPDVSSDALEIVFFDVGQGDCVLILSPAPDPKTIIVDGGYKGTADASLLPYLRARGIDTIDLMILTHPDKDHVSGLIRLLNAFEVEEIWDPGYDHDTQLYDEFVQAAEEEAGERYYCPFEDQIVSNTSLDTNDDEMRRVILGEPEQLGRIQLIPMHTDSDPEGPNDSYRRNNSSIVVKVVFGENSVLLVGDGNGRRPTADADEIEEEGPYYTESALLQLEATHSGVLQSSILKVSHHGSLSASSEQFLDRVSPQWAIITSGTTNHELPRPGTLARFCAEKANIIRTDVQDDANVPGDDHIVVLMGEEVGHMIWRQATTSQLLQLFNQ